jgi:hypothetical protein
MRCLTNRKALGLRKAEKALYIINIRLGVEQVLDIAKTNTNFKILLPNSGGTIQKQGS